MEAAIPTWSIRPTTGCGARSTSLKVHKNLLWQLSRDGNLHGLGMSHQDSLSKTFLQGTLKDGWCHGQLRKCWMNNIKKWTSLPVQEMLTWASSRKDSKRISDESSLQWPSTSRDWNDLQQVTSTSVITQFSTFRHSHIKPLVCRFANYIVYMLLHRQAQTSDLRLKKSIVDGW